MVTDPTRKQTPWRLLAWLVFVWIVSGVNYAGRLAGVEAPDDLAYRYSTAIGVVMQYAVFVAIICSSRGVCRGGRRSPSAGRPPGVTHCV